MLKKIYSYQRLLNWNYGFPAGGKMALMYTLLFLLVVASGFIQFHLGYWCIFLIALPSFTLNVAANHTSRLSRMAPVSDRFAVANLLFLFPIVVGIEVMVILLMAVLLIAVVFYNVKGGGMRIEIVDGFLRLFQNIYGSVFSGMITCGVWFLLCVGAFHRSKKRRAVWYIVICMLCIIGIIMVSFYVRNEGILRIMKHGVLIHSRLGCRRISSSPAADICFSRSRSAQIRWMNITHMQKAVSAMKTAGPAVPGWDFWR